jgi:hypothetical protein
MRTFMVALALWLTACGSDDDKKDVLYRVDDVQVVLEEGVGPEEPEMVLAAELYRREAETFWTLGIGAERALWGSIGEIRWTGESVVGGGTYRDHNLRIQWTGCAVTGELYRLLTEHYRVPGATDQDLAASRQWAADSMFICR